MILNRIQPEIDKYLRPNQNGFRPGRSTTAHILALRRLIEGVQSNNLKAIITFVDFRKAFASINRGKMTKILRAYGVLENTRARVLTPDGETDLLNIVAGVLQGDTLAPYLFAIVVDYVMRQALGDKEAEVGFEFERRRGRRHPAIIICDLDFADDIALLLEEVEQAQELLTHVEHGSVRVGLHLNDKVMAYNQEEHVNITTRSGKTLKVVKNFKYLGSSMESSEKDFEVRKALAWSSCHKLKTIWNSTLSRKIKVNLFIATVVIVWQRDLVTHQVTGEEAERMLLKNAKNMSQHLSETETYQRETLSGIASSCKEGCRKKDAAHWTLHSTHPELTGLVPWQPIKGKTSRGRPAITYIDNLRRDTGLEEVTRIREAIQDRMQ